MATEEEAHAVFVTDVTLVTTVSPGPILPGTLVDLANEEVEDEDTVLELAAPVILVLPGGVDQATVACTPLVAATAFLEPVLLPDALLPERDELVTLVADVGVLLVPAEVSSVSSDIRVLVVEEDGGWVTKAAGLVTVDEGASATRITTEVDDDVGTSVPSVDDPGTSSYPSATAVCSIFG